MIRAFLLLCLAAGAARADETIGIEALHGTTPLLPAAGARAAGVGGAFAALADDATAVFWNPAGLAAVSGARASAGHAFWFGDAGQSLVDGAVPAGKAGVVGVGFQYVTLGSYDLRAADGTKTGTYAPAGYGVAAGIGRTLFEGIAIGAAAQTSRLALADGYTLSDVAFSGGVRWSADAVRAGADIRDLGPAPADGSLRPMTGDFGLAFDAADQDVNLTLLASLELIQHGTNAVHLGAEDVIAGGKGVLRAGYRIGLAKPEHPSLEGLSLGAGLALKPLALDWGFAPFGFLGSVNQLTLTYRFD